jgi:RNase P subunit RPR2
MPELRNRNDSLGFPLLKITRLTARITKRVVCEKCKLNYTYELTREARGSSVKTLLVFLFLLPLVPVAIMASMPCLMFILPLGGGGFFFYMRIRGGGGAIPPSAIGGAVASGLTSAEDEAAMSASRRLRKELERGHEVVACPDCGWYQRDMIDEARARTATWVIWISAALIVVSQVAPFLMPRLSHQYASIDFIRTWLVCTGAGIGTAGFSVSLRWLLSRSVDPNTGFPQVRPPFPGAPSAVRAAELQAQIAASTARLNGSIAPRTLIRRRTPRLLPPGPLSDG